MRASVHLTPIVPPPAESGTATAAARSGARRRRSLGFAERIGGTARDGTVAWTDVVPGEYNLQVEKEGFRATRQPLVLGTEGAQLEIALEPGGGRLVVVPVLPAEVAADAVLRTAGRAWREGEDMVHPLHPGRQGQGSPAATVQAGGLPPGRYSVSLQVIGRGTGAPLAAFGRDIEVREGETTEARLEVAGRGMLQIQGMNLALHDAAEAARAAGASPEEVRAAIERAAEASPALPEGATARIEPLPGPETSSPALTTGPVVGKFRRTRDAGLFLEPVRLFAGRFRVVIEAAGLVVEPEEFEVVIVPNESLHRHFDLRVVE